MGKRRDRPRRPNATGRTDKSGRFVALPHRILESAAFASLDLVARGVLTELVMLFRGDNNGALWLSVRDATARLGLCDYRPALRAFVDLQDRGLVTMAQDAHFEVKASETSRARCWRLTWHSWPECPAKAKRAPTNEWERYAPPAKTPANKRAERRLKALAKHRKDDARGRLPGVISTTERAKMAYPTPLAVGESTTVNLEKDAFPPFVIVGDSTAHLDSTRGSAVLGWWSNDIEAQIAGQILLLNIVAQNRPLALAA